MFRPPSSLDATALDYGMRDVSKGSLVVPLDEKRANIKFCVKRGKSATETYNLI
jgi:hypothetical protein